MNRLSPPRFKVNRRSLRGVALRWRSQGLRFPCTCSCRLPLTVSCSCRRLLIRLPMLHCSSDLRLPTGTRDGEFDFVTDENGTVVRLDSRVRGLNQPETVLQARKID